MCGLFGVVAYREVSDDIVTKLTKSLGKASEIRGVDAGGFSILSKNGDHLGLRRNKGAITKNGVFDNEFRGRMIMGHTRFGTGASEKFNFNNHPFPSSVGKYTMAHNGILYNDNHLEHLHDLKTTKVKTDSYVVVRLLDELYGGVVNFDNLKAVSEMLTGSFNLTFLDKQGLWIVKHNNPLSILNIKELGLYIYASTDDIIENALDDFYDMGFREYLITRSGDPYGEIIPITSGIIMHIDLDGKISKSMFTSKSYTTPTYSSPGRYSNYGSLYPRDYDDFYEDEDYTNMDSAYWGADNYDSCSTNYRAISNAMLGVDPVVQELYDSYTDEYKTDDRGARTLIYNGSEYEITKPGNSKGIYSFLKGRWIVYGDNSYPVMELPKASFAYPLLWESDTLLDDDFKRIIAYAVTTLPYKLIVDDFKSIPSRPIRKMLMGLVHHLIFMHSYSGYVEEYILNATKTIQQDVWGLDVLSTYEYLQGMLMYEYHVETGEGDPF